MNLFRNPLSEGRLFDPVSLITSGIGAVGSVVGGVLGSNAAGKAANIQSDNAKRVAEMAQNSALSASQGEGSSVIGANGQLVNGTTNANATLGNVYGQQYQNLLPYLNAGTQGVNDFAAAMQPGGALQQQFQAPTAQEAANTPGEQFAMQQGQQALQRSAAATGGLLSGGTLKALDQYSQNLASTYYQQAYNNASNTFNTNRNNLYQGLTALTGVGQQASSQANTAASNYGNQAASNLYNTGAQSGQNMLRSSEYQGNVGLQGTQIAGNALTQGANSQAAGVVGQNNAIHGAINGVTNAAQYYGQNAVLPAAPNFNYPTGSSGSSIPSNYSYSNPYASAPYVGGYPG